MYIVSESRQDEEITAFHEAGHALMAILLGHPVQKISIGCAYQLDAYCQLDPMVSEKIRSHLETRIKHMVLVAMSGIAAEVLTFGQFDVSGASDDLLKARGLASCMNRDERHIDSYLNRCETQALFQLSQYWDPLCMIANCLLKYGEMDGREATRIVRTCGVISSTFPMTGGLAI